MTRHENASKQLRAEFARALGELFGAAQDTGAVQVRREAMEGAGRAGLRWRLTPTHAPGLCVAVELGRVSVGVRLSVGELSWSHDEVIAVDPEGADCEGLAAALEDALDLVATSLWGGVRVLEDRCRGQASRLRVQFGAPSRFVTHATVLAPVGVWGWVHGVVSRTETQAHTYALPPPAGIVPGRVGRNPLLPWAGVHPGSGADDSARAMPVDGVLDLHSFRPKQVRPLVLEYIQACRAKGITELRIIHGKGIGNLRRTVHALLARHEHVQAYRLAGHGAGSWGATIVTLKADG